MKKFSLFLLGLLFWILIIGGVIFITRPAFYSNPKNQVNINPTTTSNESSNTESNIESDNLAEEVVPIKSQTFSIKTADDQKKAFIISIPNDCEFDVNAEDDSNSEVISLLTPFSILIKNEKFAIELYQQSSMPFIITAESKDDIHVDERTGLQYVPLSEDVLRYSKYKYGRAYLDSNFQFSSNCNQYGAQGNNTDKNTLCSDGYVRFDIPFQVRCYSNEEENLNLCTDFIKDKIKVKEVNN